eukprot:jgi/Botrbrau1/8303/Bobra.0251s0029.1
MCLGCIRPSIEPFGAPSFCDRKQQPRHVMAKLAQVEVEISTIVSNDISHVWTVVSSHVGSCGQDQRLCGFTGHGTPLVELNLGTRKKTVIDQAGVLYEEVTAIDREKHSLKYVLINHPENVNPFPGSLLNAATCIRLFPITTNGQTFVRVRSRFFTDSACANSMKSLWTQLLMEKLQELQIDVRLARSPDQADVSRHQAESSIAQACKAERERMWNNRAAQVFKAESETSPLSDKSCWASSPQTLFESNFNTPGLVGPLPGRSRSWDDPHGPYMSRSNDPRPGTCESMPYGHVNAESNAWGRAESIPPWAGSNAGSFQSPQPAPRFLKTRDGGEQDSTHLATPPAQRERCTAMELSSSATSLARSSGTPMESMSPGCLWYNPSGPM